MGIRSSRRSGALLPVVLAAPSGGGNYWLWKERVKAVGEATRDREAGGADAMQKETAEKLAKLEAERAALVEAKEQAVKDAQAKATELAKLKDDVAGVEGVRGQGAGRRGEGQREGQGGRQAGEGCDREGQEGRGKGEGQGEEEGASRARRTAPDPRSRPSIASSDRRDIRVARSRRTRRDDRADGPIFQGDVRGTAVAARDPPMKRFLAAAFSFFVPVIAATKVARADEPAPAARAESGAAPDVTARRTSTRSASSCSDRASASRPVSTSRPASTAAGSSRPARTKPVPEGRRQFRVQLRRRRARALLLRRGTGGFHLGAGGEYLHMRVENARGAGRRRRRRYFVPYGEVGYRFAFERFYAGATAVLGYAAKLSERSTTCQAATTPARTVQQRELGVRVPRVSSWASSSRTSRALSCPRART